MIENFVTSRIVGPVLDVIGSKPRNERGTGCGFEYELIDRVTGEVIGSEQIVVGDGMWISKYFTKPTMLRRKLLEKGGDSKKML